MTDKLEEPAKITVQRYFPPLDECHYQLDPQDAAFLKKVTGIEDDAALKEHVLKAQAKAYKIAPYGCIYHFTFTRRRLSKLPAYEQILRLARERENPIFLDVGCCFGNVVREAVHDGFPAAWAIGTDLYPELWNIGHELFKSSPETYPAHFVGGNIFDAEILAVAPPASMHTTGAPSPALNLTSLNPLHGRVSVIHATAFFHLFKEDEQLHMARALAGLLSAEPGSVILGAHIAAEEKGPVRQGLANVEVEMFAHSSESWTAMWDGEVFEKGMVKVEAELIREKFGEPDKEQYWLSLFWSVTRL
ncbi:hypothetical protein K503DRAFT_773044 [Rhizopogon vinicolor AM-OR11-026]|uniref:Methyltransferase domain-containing protein n=1 Tax=Rhizopogon vinicolor AM-OR11-026 TaxID=1314800 RepID=A0A1B7MTD1_9AGAM|nr:hypothetical protein K503DRAFT_773044 [Rhizopogon vinicolor AM-OR11-026]